MKKNSVPPWIAYKFILWLNRKVENFHRKIMPAPMQMMKSLGSHISAQIIYSGIKLGIIDSLYNKSKKLDELSNELNLNLSSLNRLMRGLVAIGIVIKIPDSTYKLSKKGKAVSEHGNLKYQAIMTATAWYEGFSRLHESVISGKKELNEKFNGDFFEYIKDDTDLATNFNGSMDNLTAACIPAILAEYDFSGLKHIVDVGGGNGLFLAAILEKHKEIEGVLFDMHAVLKSSASKIRDKFAESKCKLISGDFFESVPEGGDLYILKFILHDWSDEKAAEILKNCRKAMKTGTKLVLIEFLIDEDDKSMMRIYLDLLMMTMFDGKERNQDQFETMLNKTGFKLNKILRTRSFANIIEAEAV